MITKCELLGLAPDGCSTASLAQGQEHACRGKQEVTESYHRPAAERVPQTKASH